MKQIYSLFFLLFFTVVFAQAPVGYYATATGSGYTLKTQLYNIIKGHTTLSYGELYVTYSTSDIDNFFEKDGTVLDMYSENPAGTDPYTYSIASTQRCGNYTKEGDCYNREHIIPQSIFNDQSPMVSDAHFITPTDGKVNAIRSNYPHANVTVASQTTLNGSKLGTGSISGYSGPVFEPIDEFKGDIARMYFYFATRYQNTVASYNFPMFNNSTGKVFTAAFLAQLIAWHNQDPVSEREIVRNNAIYARQNNRNPYIDNPDYVAAVWTTEPADTEAPSAVTNLTVSNKTSNTITLTWNATSDNVAVTGYDVYLNGSLKTTSTGLTATITGLLPSTDYTFYIIARDDEKNSSVASESVVGTTEPGDTQAPSVVSNLTINSTTSNTVTLTWNAATDNVAVTGYDIYLNGSLKTTSTSLTKTVTGLLPLTSYTFYIIARDEAGNLSVASESVPVTTTAAPTGGSGTTELFFSEYVEGSSFNKALEIANFTGAAIDLTGYSIKKQSNGAGEWTTGLNLTGTLNSGAVFVLVDPQMATTCYTVANANLSSAQESFNGDDPMGLFKNGVLIDIIGTFNGGTAKFGADVTLRRKPSITAPNTTFNKTTEWDSFAINTCDGIGTHTVTTLSSEDFESSGILLYPNPSNGVVKINFPSENEKYAVQVYSIIGQKVFEENFNNSNTAILDGLERGIYIVKITTSSKTFTKKLIVN
jgi:endonuclease I/chitodextrinase